MRNPKMRVIDVGAEKTPESLFVATRDVPVAADDEILVKVSAVGLNRGDCLQRIGLYPPPPGAPDIMGLELAGTIAACGKDVKNWKTGDRVAALVGGGGYSEYACVFDGHALAIPDTMSFIEAAGLPEAIFTVWANIFEHARLKSKEVLLVHGGASGIGTIAIQMAKHHGCMVIATAGLDEKCAACTQLGADHAINYRSDDFVERVLDITKQVGVDVVLDMVGGDYVAKNMACAARHGRIVNIAYMAGTRVTVDLLPVMLKNLTLTGSTLRTRPRGEKTRLTQAVAKNFWPHIGTQIKPVIDVVLPLADAGKAHARMEANQNIGKIILDCTQ